jgi:protein gp37
MNKTKIEWCDYTWNPVVGCRHNCRYCYARRLNDRFKFIPYWNEPEFFIERLTQPDRLRKHSRIFVVSMGDLWGDWVKQEWISLVMDVVERNKRHTFMFLTKNPVGYYRMEGVPDNAWLGVTVTGNTDIKRIKLMRGIPYPHKAFVSVEPLLGSCDRLELDYFQHVIVGAQTGPGAKPPEQAWIDSIRSSVNHKAILWKDNIKKYLSGADGGSWTKADAGKQ